jgi:hypothetical protein
VVCRTCLIGPLPPGLGTKIGTGLGKRDLDLPASIERCHGFLRLKSGIGPEEGLQGDSRACLIRARVTRGASYRALIETGVATSGSPPRASEAGLSGGARLPLDARPVSEKSVARRDRIRPNVSQRAPTPPQAPAARAFALIS